MAWFAFIHPGRLARAVHAAAFILMGVALEFAQGATAYRSFEVADMLANTAGVILGWALVAAAPRIGAR
jgi:glycopeptide antibiotics resistance protein